MDLFSLALLSASLAAQEPPASAPPPAVDPDALCIAAIMPGHTVLMSISSLQGPHVEYQMRREAMAIAFYLGALRGRYGDSDRMESEIATALTSFRPHGPEFRFAKANSCIDEAERRDGWLERAFPIHRLNALIGDRSSGRE